MELSTYLHFNGDCEEAFKFYERCTGGKIEAIFRTPARRRRGASATGVAKQDPARADEDRRPVADGIGRSARTL